MNQLCVVPLKRELTPFLKSLEGSFYIEQIEKTPLPIYKIKDASFYFSTCGLGKPQAALQTQFLIDKIGNVNHVFCLGTSGSISPEVKPYDVIVATTTVEHDHKEGFKKNSSLPEFKTNESFLDWAKSLEIKQLKFLKVASGDEDIISDKRSLEIHNQTNASVVAWEGAGVARTCRFNKIAFNEIRGASDLADGMAPSDFANNLVKVMQTLGQLFVDYIKSNNVTPKL